MDNKDYLKKIMNTINEHENNNKVKKKSKKVLNFIEYNDLNKENNQKKILDKINNIKNLDNCFLCSNLDGVDYDLRINWENKVLDKNKKKNKKFNFFK